MILILNLLCYLIKIELSKYEYSLSCRCKAWLKFSQIWKSWYFSNEFNYLESVLSRFNNYIYQSFTKFRSWGWWLKEHNCKRYIIFNLVILTIIKFKKGTDFFYVCCLIKNNIVNSKMINWLLVPREINVAFSSLLSRA